MIVFPIAKINLGLNIVERRPDGYHNLQTVFYPVPIQDALEISLMDEAFPSTSSCSLKVVNATIDCNDDDNLVVRAYNLLKADFPNMPRIYAHLWKGIPSQAGMGGGSSDCAFMIRLLNKQFDLGLTDKRMMNYAARLGADCAFFILSRPCYAEGIGERLTPIDLDLTGWKLCVVRPNIPVPTKEAFSHIRPHYPSVNCLDVVKRPVDEWRELLFNDFEESVFTLHPEIGNIKQQLYDMGATYAAMSGSGSAVFGLFKEKPGQFAQAFSDMFHYCCTL